MAEENRRKSGLRYRCAYLSAVLIVVVVVCIPAGLGIGNSKAVSGNRYYAIAEGTGGMSVYGIEGHFTVSNPSVVANELAAVYINMEYSTSQSWQIGFQKGGDPKGGSNLYYYVESPEGNNNMWHTAVIGEVTILQIMSIQSGNRMYVQMTATTPHDIYTWTGTTYYSIGTHEAFMSTETSSTQNVIPMGGAVNLRYQTTLGPPPTWQYWTGWRYMVSDSPYVIGPLDASPNVSHNYDVIFWTDTHSRLNDAFWGRDLHQYASYPVGDEWSTHVNPNGYVGTDMNYYSPDWYSLKVAKSTTVTDYSYAKHTFPIVSSGVLYAVARIRTDSSCSNGFAYFYVGGGQVTFAFESGYLGWYDPASSNWVQLCQYSIGTWYEVTFTINTGTGSTYTTSIKDLSTGLVKGTWTCNLRGSSPHSFSDLQFTAGWNNLGGSVNMWVDNVNVHT